MSLFSGTITSLEQALNYSSTKQKVISQNIANVDTPNYKAKSVSFKSAFQEALGSNLDTYRTDKRHYTFQKHSSGQAVIINNKQVSYNENDNSVDIDQEMSDLAANQIYYNALTERINGKFSTLQNVIRGGR